MKKTKSKSKSKVRVPRGLTIVGPKEAGDTWARILLLGAAKTGKTTSVLLTAPQPIFVINCDDSERNQTALLNAARMGAKYTAANVRTIAQWHAVQQYAVDLAEAEEAQTIVLDTITLLGQNILMDLKQQDWNGDTRAMWGEFLDEMQMGMHQLLRVDAHLIVIAHPMPGEDTPEGLLPAMPGKAAAYIPARFADWIWFEFDPKEDPERGFLVGPQKHWRHGARHAKRSARVEADVCALFEELGIEP